jgi:hypothetical protein
MVISISVDGAEISGCTILPANHALNTRIDSLPLHANSDAYIQSIGADETLHPDFGAGEWPPGSGSPIGIPFIVVGAAQPPVNVSFTYAGESDPGPYPIPSNPPIEGGPAGTGDRHILIVDSAQCLLYELFYAFPNGNGTWVAGSGAIFDLSSNALRPEGWTSADAAGLPILPALIRYEEVEAGEIAHAIRFTAAQTRRAYVWPARHFASSLTGVQYPPMGQRFRLKAGYDISGFSAPIQVILNAFKRYGIILADNGSDWFISGAPDERWDNGMLRELKVLEGNDFEAVDVSALMIDPDSAQTGSIVPRIQDLNFTGASLNLDLEGLIPGVPHTIEHRGPWIGSSWSPVSGLVPASPAESHQLPTPSNGFYRLSR